MEVTADPTDGLGQAELLRRLEEVAMGAARRLIPAGEIELALLNQSENTTYRVRAADSGEKLILRIHRTGYHSVRAIESELAWLDALREEAGIRTPRVLSGSDGARIHHIVTEALPAGRHCVFFEFLEGEEPDPENLLASFPMLGEITARMHEHVRGWRLPGGFERFRWDFETSIGSKPHWGHWYDGLAMTPDARATLQRLADTIERRLRRYGTGTERFGLVHADMRLANLLLHEGETRVIDFDDGGFSWFLYDLAAAVSFVEDRTDMAELIAAWLEGYRRVRALPQADEDEIPTFIMLRRLLLVAWVGSHRETDLARNMGERFTAVSCELAERYLGGFS